MRTSASPSAANTLWQDGGGATGIFNGVAGNLVGVDPKLGPLQSNGGPTPTMALLPGSPAIDAGSNPLGLTTDQRGSSRGSSVPPPTSVHTNSGPLPRRRHHHHPLADQSPSR